MVVTILGGVGTLYGPIVGAFAYTGMKDVISKLIGNWELFIGFLLVFIMLAGEKGIWSSLGRCWKSCCSATRPRRERPAPKRRAADGCATAAPALSSASIGSIFFLMAIGLSLCFGLMRIISLDQMLYYSIAPTSPIPSASAQAASGSACSAGAWLRAWPRSLWKG